MHGLAHITRRFAEASKLASNRDYCQHVLLLGVYFHNIFNEHQAILAELIDSKGLSCEHIPLITCEVLESIAHSIPKSMGGLLLYDADLNLPSNLLR